MLRLAWRKRLGGPLVLPRHLFVSLPASQTPVPPERMTAWPLNQNKLSLNFGNIRQNVRGRNVCVAPGGRGQADSPPSMGPPTAPTPCCLTQPPHPVRPPSPHPNPSPFYHPSFFSILNFQLKQFFPQKTGTNKTVNFCWVWMEDFHNSLFPSL